MATHIYQDKLLISQDKELHKILDKIYMAFFPDKSVVRIEYDNSLLFQRSGRDLRVILKKPGNGSVDLFVYETIEEKIRSASCSRYDDILIEYLSNKEYGTLGWIYTSEADWLSYVKQPENFVEVFVFPMKPLKQWFMFNWKNYKDVETNTKVGASFYTTVNKVIPLQDPKFQSFLEVHGFFHKIVSKVDEIEKAL
jgi:hypothetical protein